MFCLPLSLFTVLCVAMVASHLVYSMSEPQFMTDLWCVYPRADPLTKKVHFSKNLQVYFNTSKDECNEFNVFEHLIVCYLQLNDHVLQFKFEFDNLFYCLLLTFKKY